MGIDKYQILGNLNYARHDAEQFALVLHDQCKFVQNYITVMSCHAEGRLLAQSMYIKKTFDDLIKERDLDLFVVGFWGHGLLPAVVPQRTNSDNTESKPKELPNDLVFDQDAVQEFQRVRKIDERAPGGPNAQNRLGVCYLNGEGVSQDKTEAVSWFHKAAENLTIYWNDVFLTQSTLTNT